MIKGCDIYSGNGSPSLAGYDFVFIKATEGVGESDSGYAARRQRVYDAGLVFGAYHFGWENESVASQAEHFVSVARPRPGDILYLDFEGYSDNRNWSGLSWAQRDAWRLDWISRVRALTHGQNRIGTYCDVSVWKSIPSNDPGDFLFIAEYGVSQPNIRHSWQFWQHSDSPIDQDYGQFASRAALAAWANPQSEDDVASPQWINGVIAPGQTATVALVPHGNAWSAYANRTLHLGMDDYGGLPTEAVVRVALHSGSGWHDIGTHTVTASGGTVDVSVTGSEKISMAIESGGPVSYGIEVW